MGIVDLDLHILACGCLAVFTKLLCGLSGIFLVAATSGVHPVDWSN